MAHSKPLLMPWLRAQINSQHYPGVYWTNSDQTEFSIPWKHALRQDSSDSDILIFKAWAEVSGNGRALGDPSVWKRNFRSALRVKGFEMIQDNKNDTANPHKIYRWPDETGSSKSNSSLSPDQLSPGLLEDYPLSTQDSQPYLESVTHVWTPSSEPHGQDILQQCLIGLNIGSEQEGFEPPPEQQRPVEQNVIGACVLRGQPQDPVGCEGAVHGVGLPGQPAQPMNGPVGGAVNQQHAEFLSSIAQADDGSHFKTGFRVKVFYRGKLVSEELIQNETGVRIVFRPDMKGAVDPESGLSYVSLPNPENMVDRTQAALTQRVLDSLHCLDVGVSGHVVFGQRRGETRAYWSFSNFDQSRQPREVPKEPHLLYEFKDFLKGIIDFIEGKERPHSSLFFCLGEKWPDPDNKAWNKKLIMVEVVLTSMELLNQLAVAGGASSLQSVELQLSLEEMMDMF